MLDHSCRPDVRRMTRHGTLTSCGRCARGFSLIEVMVALIVLCVGLLGIARMQSLALSSTTVAAQRSLAAVEADSLAAMMHANRGYWTNADPANATIQISGNTFTFNGAPALAAAGNPLPCVSPAVAVSCTPTVLAAYELHDWATQLQSMLPGNFAQIQCGTNTPVSCLVTITWAENGVAVNAQEAGAAAQAQTANTTGQAANTSITMQNPTYTLYVQP